MKLSGLSNKVLSLLLAQNSLQITSSRKQLIEWLVSVSPLISSATRTRNADASASATTCLPPNHQEPGGSNIHGEPWTKWQQPRWYPRWRPQWGSSYEPCTRSSTSAYVDKQHSQSKAEELYACPAKWLIASNSASSVCYTSQPSTTRHLADPTFVASLLSHLSTSASADLPLPSSTPSSSLTDHVSIKTKQAILRSEEVVTKLRNKGGCPLTKTNTKHKQTQENSQ